MKTNRVLFKGPLPSDYPFIYIDVNASKTRSNARKKITMDMPLKRTGEKYRATVPELACSAVAVDCRNQSLVCSCWFSGVKNNCNSPMLNAIFVLPNPLN